jgi:hypothetical protein
MSEPVILGYWRQRQDGLREMFHPADSHLPWPEANILTDQEVQYALGTLSLLENHRDIKIDSYRGYSGCRLCGRLNGTREFSLTKNDIEYRWPEGLKHYIAEHRVALPKRFEEIV